MTRVYNFGAGPAILPEEILKQAQEELLNWRGTGMSIVETSVRAPSFMEMLAEAEQDLRDLLTIPEQYKVLFIAGPARAQFAMIPMNLSHDKKTADYIDTGIWSYMASEEAKRYIKVNIVASSKESKYTYIPPKKDWQLNPDAAYVYYTANETINGVEFLEDPDTGNIPLVSDMTSNLLSKPLDITKFGLIFAGAQKNIAPAGLTIVIVREDLIGHPLPSTPTVYDYKIQADNKSLYNTACSFSCYMAGLMFRWLKKQGSLDAIYIRNRRKAEKLYQAIDESDFYINHIDPQCRSLMNVPFILPDETLTPEFLKQAKLNNLTALKGHRLLGGLRASIYNAMPEEGIDQLIAFMRNFEKQYG